MPISTIDFLLGSGIGQRAVVLGAVGVYAYLFVARPDDAVHAVKNALRTFGRLFTLIIAALLVAAAIGAIVPSSSIQSVVGEAAGLRGAVLAGLLGGLIPGGPYAVYPIVSGVGAAGSGAVAVLAMVVGYGAIGIGRVPYGLVFFDAKTVGLRVIIAIVLTVIAAVGVFVFL